MKALRIIRATGVIASCVFIIGLQSNQYRDSFSQAFLQIRHQIFASKRIEFSVVDTAGDSSILIANVKWGNLWWAIREAGSNPSRKLKVCLKERQGNKIQLQQYPAFSIID